MNHRDLQFTFELDGLPADTFAVIKFSGEESLSTPYAFEIELASRQEDITPDKTVDRTGTLYVWRNGLIESKFNGIISSFVQGNSGHHHTFYTLSLVPALLRSDLRQNSRIFQQLNVQDIITILLQEMGTTDFVFDLTSSPQEREFCVQYRETDLAFIQRLAAEEGIYYHFIHTDSTHTLRFSDSTQTADFLKKPMPYHATAGGDAPSTYIRSFTRKTQIRPSSAKLKDYSFKKPAYSFLQSHEGTEMEFQHGTYEHYDFPGRYKSDAQGKPFTKYRLEHLRSDAITALGKSNISQLSSGAKFDLAEHPEDACNRDWLLVDVFHFGEQTQALEEAGGTGSTNYHNEFTVIPSNRPWRPKPNAKPRVDGPQMGFVVGPEGEEIFCDEYGRVKVHFMWDRYSNVDDTSSCWIRVSQGWAGAQYGSIAIPRIGHEVIVSFIEGDPDQPIITGRTYHAKNQPPYTLPEHKTRTVLRTNTHQGSGANEVRFEDQAAKEEIYIHAQKDMNLVVKNDRTDNVKNDAHLVVENMRYQKVVKDDHLTIGGESRTHVGKDQSITVDGSTHMKHGKSYLIETGSEVHFKAGAKVVIEAGAELTLAAGGSFVTVDSAGVHLSGAKINLNSGGAAGVGSGFAGELPEPPVIPKTV